MIIPKQMMLKSYLAFNYNCSNKKKNVRQPIASLLKKLVEKECLV